MFSVMFVCKLLRQVSSRLGVQSRHLLVEGSKIGKMLLVHFVAMKNLLAIHSEAVEKIVTLPRTTRHVGELLSTEVSEDRKRRASLLQILRALRYLARQGLSIRGSSLTNEIEGKISHCFVHLIVIFHYG